MAFNWSVFKTRATTAVFFVAVMLLGLLWMLVIGYIITLAAFVEVTAWTRHRGTITREVEVPAPR